jgi:very-short-patch-repair endonuclease
VHGIFLQRASDHLAGNGCQKCGAVVAQRKLRSTKDEFVKASRLVHGDAYDYSFVEYFNNRRSVLMRCIKHDLEFHQSPLSHVSGSPGCKKCSKELISKFHYRKVTHKEFVRRAKKFHGNKFDYSRVVFANTNSIVDISCRDCGAEFRQSVIKHMHCNGCPVCKESRGESAIRNWLVSSGFSFSRGKKFDTCRHKNRLPFDFFVQESMVLIEYDGRQHFEPVDRFGGQEALELCQLRDSIKTKWAADNGYRLIRISYKQFKAISKILDREFGLVNG